MNRGYLGLKARYSQAWLASPFIVIVIFMVRLILLKQFIETVLSLARKFMLMECAAMQQVAQGATEAPQEMIKLANKLISASVNEVIRGAMKAFSSTVSVAEALILFAIEMTIGTYACLALSAVNIGANEALDATESVMKLANSTIQSATKDINAGLGKLTKLINGAVGLFDSVEDFITGGDSEVDKINLTIAKLNDFNIPSDVNAKIESLREKVPTYNGTMNKVESLIKTPLNEVKTMIMASNQTLKLSFVPNTTLHQNNYNIPQCNKSEVNRIFDDLGRLISRVTIVLCVLCALGLIGGILFNMYKARSRFQRLVLAAETTSRPSNPFADNSEKESEQTTHEKMAAITYHLETSWPERYLQKFIPSSYWWALQYSFSLPLVGFLLIGLAGIILGLLELVLTETLRTGLHKLAELESEAVGNLGNIITRAYVEWQNQTNSEITQLQSSVNDQFLGWIHHGSKGINSTIASILDGINRETNATFYGTPLLKPLQAATACLIGNKLTKVEKGLTWLYDNSQITLPRVNDTLLSNIRNGSTVTRSEHQALLLVDSAVNSLLHEIKTQFIVSGVLAGLWLLLTLLAIFHTRKSTFRSVNLSVPKKPIQNFKNWSTSSSISRRRRPEPLRKVEVSSPVRVRSPIERMADRVTRIFSGPAHQVAIDSLMSPKKASIYNPETPKTPLRAMMFRNH